MSDWSARNAVAVTPSDSATLSPSPVALYVGGAGNIALRAVGSGADVTFVGVPAGTTLWVRASAVRATGTTATSIVALN